MPNAAVFDIDGTLVDSVDLHALAWHEAFVHFGHDVSVLQARSQIGKGGDNLLPEFLTDEQIDDYGPAIEEWRGKRFKSKYLCRVQPFSAVPALFRALRAKGIKLAVASSAKKDELEIYVKLAQIEFLLDASVSSEDVETSKPAPDVFQAAATKLSLPPANIVAVGDSPYDAQAATQAGMTAIGFLSGCFTEHALREAGCIQIYPGPGGLFACLDSSVFGSR